MIRMAVAWLALSCPQDPDRSTPEKTTENFLAFGQKLQQDDGDWKKIMVEIQTLGDFCRTDEYKARLAKRNEEAMKRLEDRKILSSKNEILKTTAEKDGGVTVEAVQKLKRRERNFETGKVEETETALPHRLILTPTGKVWQIREYYRSCGQCGGQGQCESCKGTGEAFEQKCYACDGRKVCKECQGEKLKREDFAEAQFQLITAEAEPSFSTDLSSPKAAAQAYVDLLLRQGLEVSRRLRAWIESILTQFRHYFVPDLVKKVEEAVAKDIEAGKKRFREDRPKLESVEEKGETAYALVLTQVDFGEPTERKQRIVFRRVGGKWLVNAEQNPCMHCQGSGRCGACQGSGKFGDGNCFGCEGMKTCKRCEGNGWMDDLGGGF